MNHSSTNRSCILYPQKISLDSQQWLIQRRRRLNLVWRTGANPLEFWSQGSWGTGNDFLPLIADVGLVSVSGDVQRVYGSNYPIQRKQTQLLICSSVSEVFHLLKEEGIKSLLIWVWFRWESKEASLYFPEKVQRHFLNHTNGSLEEVLKPFTSVKVQMNWQKCTQVKVKTQH